MTRRRHRKIRTSSIDLKNCNDYSNYYLKTYIKNILGSSFSSFNFLDYSIELLNSNSLECLYNALIPELKDFLDGEEKSLEKLKNNLLRNKELFSQLSRMVKYNIDDEELIHISEPIIIDLIEKEIIDNSITNDMSNNKFKKLQEILLLDKDEITILRFFIYFLNNQSINWGEKTSGKAGIIRLIHAATEVEEYKIKKLLGRKSKLVSSNIIDIDDNYIEVNSTILEFIDGILDEKDLLDDFIKINKDKTYELETFEVKKQHFDLILSILKSDMPSNLLFYGEPGSGKTELAKSIIHHLGKQALFLAQQDSPNEQNDRKMALTIANNIFSQNDILVIDEADAILNEHIPFFFQATPTEKGWINDYLDNSKAKIIWITNKIDNIDPSVLRRFNYSVQFSKINEKQRTNYWNNILKDYSLKNIIQQNDITVFSKKYPVSAGGIASTVKTVNSLYQGQTLSQENILTTMNQILSQHSELLESGSRFVSLKEITDNYDLSFLNIDTDLDLVMNTLKCVHQKLEEDKGEFANLNLLLCGTPGTGKTEFVKYISKTLDKAILIKRYSDLESMWVGETEKNIRKAFIEAADSQKILFIDEADSLFTNRGNAHRSWEVSRTNELLTQMENFNGIFVCATNLETMIDPAAMRRFYFKIQFMPVKKVNRLSLYQRYFSTINSEMTNEQMMDVDSLENLTVGDVNAVLQKFQYSDIKKLEHQKIIDALKSELHYKTQYQNKTAGFLS